MFSDLIQDDHDDHQQKAMFNYSNLKINYLRLKELLCNLGMINEATSNIDSNGRALLYDLWRLLQGELREEVNLEDVKVVIMSILRMNDHKRIGVSSEEAQTEHQRHDPRDFGFYNNKDKFCLRIEDISKIQKHFNLLYLNRL